MNKKFILLKGEKFVTLRHMIGYSTTLYRIQALKDFGDVKKGDLGGWVEKESNLSHEGNCWIYNDAIVYGNAKIHGNAKVYDNATVYNSAMIYNSAEIYGNAKVYGNAIVYRNAKVFGNARLFYLAQAYGNAIIHGECELDIQKIGRDGDILDFDSFISIGRIGSRSDYTTFYKTSSGDIMVSCGCFNDTIAEFEKAVKHTHKYRKIYLDQYMGAIDAAKIKLLNK